MFCAHFEAALLLFCFTDVLLNVWLMSADPQMKAEWESCDHSCNPESTISYDGDSIFCLIQSCAVSSLK